MSLFVGRFWYYTGAVLYAIENFLKKFAKKYLQMLLIVI